MYAHDSLFEKVLYRAFVLIVFHYRMLYQILTTDEIPLQVADDNDFFIIPDKDPETNKITYDLAETERTLG